MLNLQIGVKQSQFDKLELISMKHLTYEEVNDLIKPTDNTLDLVHKWLEANGIIYVTYSPTIDWINIDVNIQTTKRLLDAEYYTFQHEDGTKVVRAPEWSLPKHLYKHPYPGLHNPTSPILKKVCTINGTTPDYFSTLYQTKGYVQKATGKNQIGFNNFLGEIPIRPNTKQFLSRYRPDAIPRASEYKFVDITSGPSQDTSLTPAQAESGISIKANLDI
ncbi:Pro-kumamolisin, activation domain containing protein [Hyaloscypha variabilis]